MSSKTIRATKDGRTVEATYDFGDSLEEMSQKFGEEVVRSSSEQQMTIGIQGIMRRMIQQGKEEAEITQRVAEYVPGVAGQKQDPVEKFKAKWANLSPEDRDKLLDELKQMNQ